MPERPQPSLLRGFSAPVKLDYPYSRDQLMFFMQHDSDGFNRWEAGQQLSVRVLQELIGQHQRGEALALDKRLIGQCAVCCRTRRWMQRWLPRCSRCQAKPTSPRSAKWPTWTPFMPPEFARKRIADALFEPLWHRYQANRETSRNTAYVASAEHFARRALQNIALSYLMLSEKTGVLEACTEQFEHADNMTERLTARRCWSTRRSRPSATRRCRPSPSTSRTTRW